jgi:proline-specific peptidase
MAHNYLLPLTSLTSSYSIPTIFYDQLGCGQSTHLRDKDRDFWSEKVFIAELKNLITKLGLEETGYDILGSSWGGMLASSFAATQPRGLRRLILSNSPADMAMRIKANTDLRALLPEDVQATLKTHEQAGTITSPEYLAACAVFDARFICNVTPIPPDLQDSIAAMLSDRTVGLALSGPERWENTGNLKNWSMVGKAGAIEAETLLINGNHEIVSDESVRPFWREIPRVKWCKMMGSSHSPHLEETERYCEIVGEFLVAE